MRIIFLVPYPPGEAPSQRFRFEQYIRKMEEAGHTTVFHSFLSLSAWQALYKKGNHWEKIKGTVQGYLRRMIHVISAVQFDVVFIHREISPFGPPIFEFILSKILRKKIIYDFDDAIWIAENGTNWLTKFKSHSKIRKIISWSVRVSCGNQFLADFAKRYNRSVVINPTTIDTINLHNFVKTHQAPGKVIGWTGSHSTLKYLRSIIPALVRLAARHEFDFLVISNEPPEFQIPNLKFKRWSKQSEVKDLAEFDIGVMPLTNDQWAEGKCGFKILQYMAMGIPAVASPVGMNRQLIESGQRGILCETEREWELALEALLISPNQREKIGAAGRKFVEAHYSQTSNTKNFLSLFEL